MIESLKRTSTPETFLAFDFGSKTIGIATGETLTQSATPLSTIQVKNNTIPWETILNIIQDWQPTACIVGWPVGADQTPLAISGRAQHFAKNLHKQSKLTIYLEDEHLSTKEAKQRLHQRYGTKALHQTRIDDMAACVILESFLASYPNVKPFMTTDNH